MADIYLYVPCNGTRYYTANDVDNSTHTIYGDTELDSYQDGNRIYTEFNNRALFIENDSATGIDGSYTLEWWQKDAGTTSSNNLLTISNFNDSNKLQLHNYFNSNNSSLKLRFEEQPISYYALHTIEPFDNTTWTHFAYVLDYDNHKYYYFKDGVYQSKEETKSTTRNPLYFACIGAKGTMGTNYADEFFGGKISDIVFYKGVKYLENETFTPPVQSPDTTGLIAYGTPSIEPQPVLVTKYYATKQGKGRTNAVKLNNKYYIITKEEEE